MLPKRKHTREGRMVEKALKICFVCLVLVLSSRAGAQVATVLSDTIPKEQQAQIEGLCYSAMMGPYVKENWPDLRSFSIKSVTGDNVEKFSSSEAVVGPGNCVVTVEVRTRQHGTATLTLTFAAEAGGRYALRPVYRGSGIHASIQNVETGDFVARTWPARKPKVHDEPALADAP